MEYCSIFCQDLSSSECSMVMKGEQRLGFLISFFEVKFFIIFICVSADLSCILIISERCCFLCRYFWPVLTSTFPFVAEFFYQVNLSNPAIHMYMWRQAEQFAWSLYRNNRTWCSAGPSLDHEMSIRSLELFLIRH